MTTDDAGARWRHVDTRRWRDDPLWRATALLNLSVRKVVLAVMLGVLALGSAVALAAVSAWLPSA